MKKFKPYLIIAGVVVAVLVVYKMIKPSLPNAVTAYLPI